MNVRLFLPPEEIARLRERAGGHTLAPLVAAGLAAALDEQFPAHVWELYGVRYLPTRESFRARKGRGLDLGDRRAAVPLVVSVADSLAMPLKRYASRNNCTITAVVTCALVAAGLVVTGPHEGERRKRGRRPLDGGPREKVTVYLSASACALIRDAAGIPRHVSLSRAVLALLGRVSWDGAPPARPEPEEMEKARCSLNLPAPVVASLRAFAREHVRPLASGILTALSLAETAQKGGAK